MKEFWKEKLKKLSKRMGRLPAMFAAVLDYIGRRHVATIAGASAFWLFLSLVPLVILVMALLPYTPVTEEALRTVIFNNVPESFQSLLQGIVSDVYSSNAALLSLSLFTTLWSSSTGFSAVIRGLEEIYDPPVRASYFRRRFRGILYTVIFIAALLLTILLTGFGRTLQAFLESRLPFLQGFFHFLLKLRFTVMPAVLTVFFAALYRWAPGLELSYVRQLPGALFAALGWSGFSAVFSFWMRLTNGYGTYGSLATVAVVMVWLFYCISILLWGACLNKAIDKLRKA